MTNCDTIDFCAKFDAHAFVWICLLAVEVNLKCCAQLFYFHNLYFRVKPESWDLTESIRISIKSLYKEADVSKN